MEIRFTILTATYNRANTLRRVADSLNRQDNRLFEWLVVDDGSSDHTPTLIEDFKADYDFPIVFIQKENGGKHTALNEGFRMARGEFIFILDSDDYLTDNALRLLSEMVDTINPFSETGIAGLATLNAYENGEIIGTQFPADGFDSDFISIRLDHKVLGDKSHIIRREVLLQYPFPTFEGEKFLAESIIWMAIAAKYKVRFFNKVLKYCEYLPGGLSDLSLENRIRSPNGARLLYLGAAEEHLAHRTLKERLRYMANYIRFSLHSLRGNQRRRLDLSVRSYTLFLVAMPIGAAAFIRDVLTLRRLGDG